MSSGNSTTRTGTWRDGPLSGDRRVAILQLVQSLRDGRTIHPESRIACHILGLFGDVAEPEPGPDLEWRDVPGFPGYQISNYGKLRSARLTGGRAGKRHVGQRTGDQWRVLAGSFRGNYRYYGLIGPGNRRLLSFAHRLVAMAFLAPPLPGQTMVRHLDDNPLNNHVSNLAWGTSSDNSADAKRNGRTSRGERGGNTNLTSEQVQQIIGLWSSGLRQKQIAARLGVSRGAVWNVLWGRSWVAETAIPELSPGPTHGERNGNGKLDGDDVREIVRLWKAGASQEDIGTRFGITSRAVGCIVGGLTWRRVTGLRPGGPGASSKATTLARMQRGEQRSNAKLTAESVQQIVRLCRSGESQRSVGKQFGVSHSVVRGIMNGKKWASVTGISPSLF